MTADLIGHLAIEGQPSRADPFRQPAAARAGFLPLAFQQGELFAGPEDYQLTELHPIGPELAPEVVECSLHRGSLRDRVTAALGWHIIQCNTGVLPGSILSAAWWAACLPCDRVPHTARSKPLRPAAYSGQSVGDWPPSASRAALYSATAASNSSDVSVKVCFPHVPGSTT